MIFGVSGSSRATTDSVIGTSGVPIRLFAANVAVTGTVAGNLVLRNGTGTDGTIWVTEESKRGTQAANLTFFYGEQGILFSSGLFYDHDAAFTSVTFQYRVEA